MHCTRQVSLATAASRTHHAESAGPLVNPPPASSPSLCWRWRWPSQEHAAHLRQTSPTAPGGSSSPASPTICRAIWHPLWGFVCRGGGRARVRVVRTNLGLECWGDRQADAAWWCTVGAQGCGEHASRRLGHACRELLGQILVANEHSSASYVPLSCNWLQKAKHLGASHTPYESMNGTPSSCSSTFLSAGSEAAAPERMKRSEVAPAPCACGGLHGMVQQATHATAQPEAQTPTALQADVEG